MSACVWRWEGEGVKREGVLNQFYSHETVPLILKQLRFENVFFSPLSGSLPNHKTTVKHINTAIKQRKGFSGDLKLGNKKITNKPTM